MGEFEEVEEEEEEFVDEVEEVEHDDTEEEVEEVPAPTRIALPASLTSDPRCAAAWHGRSVVILNHAPHVQYMPTYDNAEDVRTTSLLDDYAIRCGYDKPWNDGYDASLDLTTCGDAMRDFPGADEQQDRFDFWSAGELGQLGLDTTA